VRTRLLWAAIGAALALTALTAVAAIRSWLYAPPPPQVVPPDVVERLVPVETVREIPGPVVERVRWRTREVPVGDDVVAELARALCTSGPSSEVEKEAVPAPAPQLAARVEISAERWDGVDAAGAPVAGWTGEAACLVRAGGGPELELARAPIDLEASSAIAEHRAAAEPLARRVETALGITSHAALRAELRAYGRGRRWGWWVAADWDPSPAETWREGPVEYSGDVPIATGGWRELDGWTLAAGVARRWGR